MRRHFQRKQQQLDKSHQSMPVIAVLSLLVSLVAALSSTSRADELPVAPAGIRRVSWNSDPARPEELSLAEETAAPEKSKPEVEAEAELSQAWPWFGEFGSRVSLLTTRKSADSPDQNLRNYRLQHQKDKLPLSSLERIRRWFPSDPMARNNLPRVARKRLPLAEAANYAILS